jgi:hypothetical protein
MMISMQSIDHVHDHIVHLSATIGITWKLANNYQTLCVISVLLRLNVFWHTSHLYFLMVDDLVESLIVTGLVWFVPAIKYIIIIIELFDATQPDDIDVDDSCAIGESKVPIRWRDCSSVVALGENNKLETRLSLSAAGVNQVGGGGQSRGRGIAAPKQDRLADKFA